MRYRMARVLGRADGPDVTRCGYCRALLRRGAGVVPNLAARECCSVECAERADELLTI